jgi:hypothetical protein
LPQGPPQMAIAPASTAAASTVAVVSCARLVHQLRQCRQPRSRLS